MSSIQPSEALNAVPDPEPRPRRHRDTPSRRRARNHRRLRLVYFGLASVWGFLTGTVALLGALSMTGRTVKLEFEIALSLLAAAGFALAGAVLAARAYREAVRRAG